ncbi:hypothetical protein MK805_14660 [Shimazuella sp. AN120528]|uniref:hypothetical protein n=1 Tax=Shimazuella soli TaxID=1892854 RepID=UPI001F0D541D|nr:hypothetical protein [Shimazuella soli]MCH5586181.1 hypothetical protein [Shimazuella soli]
MENRRKRLKVIALVLFVMALLGGTYKLSEHFTEKESYQRGYSKGHKDGYREGYTFGYVEGHTNGYVKGVEADGKSEAKCEINYNMGWYAYVHCSRTINGKRHNAEWVWYNESYVGPGPEGVPATSGPNAPDSKK